MTKPQVKPNKKYAYRQYHPRKIITKQELNSFASIGNDEYEVYSASLLQEAARRISKEPEIFVVHLSTSTGPQETGSAAFTYLGLNVKELCEHDLFRNFKVINSKPLKLENRFSVLQRVVLLPEREFDELFANKHENGWDKFYKKYPGSPGITGFSRVGFNKNKTRALLYRGNQADWLAGTGCLSLFEKRGGQWTVEKEITIWKS
jgi:hypothetical protein